MNVIHAKAKTAYWKVTSHPATALCSLALAEDGTLWAADYDQGSGKDGHVYHFSTSGNVLTTVRLPRPSASATYTPQAQTLLIVENTLWMADFSAGIIYRHDTRQIAADSMAEMVYISPVARASMPRGQFWALAYQRISIDTAYQGLIWFNDVNAGMLFAIDATSPAITSDIHNPAKLVTLNISSGSATSARDLIFDPDGVHLWVVVAHNSDPSASVLQRVPAIKSVVKSDIKTWAIEGALSLTLHDRQLYIGTFNGKIYTMDLSQAASQPRLFATLPQGTKTKRAPVLDYLVQDAAHFLWAVDTNEGGELYEVSPAGAPVCQYTLDDAARSVIPGGILWSNTHDTFYIADMSPNGRVMVITPENAIDRNGKAKYTLSASPSSGTAGPGTSFAPFRLSALLIGSGHPVAANILLTVHDTPQATAEFAAGGKQQHVAVPATGEAAVVLTAGPHVGKVTVEAQGRGLPGTVIYSASIQTDIISLQFSPPLSMSTAPHNAFDLAGARVVITPADPDREITLKIESSSDAHFASGLQNTLIHAGGALPGITAGKRAGKVIVTAEAGGKSQSIALQVIPYPAELFLPDWGVVHRIGLKNRLEDGIFNVSGYTIDKDMSSPLIPVDSAKVTLELDPAGSVEFTGGQGRYQAVLITDDQGNASMKKSGISIQLPNNVSQFRLTCTAGENEGNPAHPVVKKSLPVRITS